MHLINRGYLHFEPILGRQKVEPSKLLLNEREQKIINKKLFNAVEQNSLQKVKKHLDEGANVNARNANNKNNTPIHVSFLKGESEIAKLLLDKGAKTDIENSANETTLDIAGRFSYGDISSQLNQAKGSAINRQNTGKNRRQ